MGIFNSHPGSWGGLPDFGVTEAIQKILSPQSSYSSQGGSNIVGGYNTSNTNTITPTPVPTPGMGQVSGQNTGIYGPAYPGQNTSITPQSNPYQPTNQTNNTSGGLTADILRTKFGFNDPNTINNILSDPNQSARYLSELGGSSGGNSWDSGYNDYIGQLETMMNTDLPNQRSSQEGIINSQYDTGLSTIGSQKTQAESDLNVAKAKSIKDIGNNIGHAMQAANNLLGGMGAGDSSAARQYSYALSKMGTQQMGEVAYNFNLQKQKLSYVYNDQSNQLRAARDQGILEVATWFSQQQQSLRGQEAQVAMQRSNQALQYAQQQLQYVQQTYSNQSAALANWSLARATTLKQAQDAISQFGSLPTQQYNYAPTSSTPPTTQSYYPGSNTDTTKSTSSSSLFPQYNYLS